jgi:peroxiredoxin Q/BCP
MSEPSSLDVGALAPDFTAVAVGGEYGEGASVRLSQFRGRRVVLYFYPRDLTPGCTQQACALRDHWAEVSPRAVVFGVSTDGPASHRKFIEKEGLPFPLLSDESGELVRAYGVWVEKKMYGRTSMGTERSTFVIGADGKLEAVFRKVSPKTHLEQVLGAI